ncbi:MAG: winged helix-turn-helix domain-containing protein, partial [Oscillospiraceae bacterium]
AINIDAHSVTVGVKKIELTLKEFEILALLLKNKGKVLTRDMLLKNIWDYDFDGETRTVDVHIRTLRSKLLNSGDIIETIRGVGYRIG